jgi:hypothetical protein
MNNPASTTEARDGFSSRSTCSAARSYALHGVLIADHKDEARMLVAVARLVRLQVLDDLHVEADLHRRHRARPR